LPGRFLDPSHRQGAVLARPPVYPGLNRATEYIGEVSQNESRIFWRVAMVMGSSDVHFEGSLMTVCFGMSEPGALGSLEQHAPINKDVISK
jgi:hypothetical protein